MQKYTRLLENDIKMGFMLGQYDGTGQEGTFVTVVAERAHFVAAKIEGVVDLANHSRTLGWGIVDAKIVQTGEKYITYAMIDLSCFLGWPSEVPVGGECYADMDERLVHIQHDLAVAKQRFGS